VYRENLRSLKFSTLNPVTAEADLKAQLSDATKVLKQKLPWLQSTFHNKENRHTKTK
jgi:hypothetical protein